MNVGDWVRFVDDEPELDLLEGTPGIVTAVHEPGTIEFQLADGRVFTTLKGQADAVARVDAISVASSRPVGYVSGSNIQPGAEPEARHLAVYVNKKGYPVTAFPCTPEVFGRSVQ